MNSKYRTLKTTYRKVKKQTYLFNNDGLNKPKLRIEKKQRAYTIVLNS